MIKSIIEKFNNERPEDKLIFVTITGSFLHGSNINSSDIDYKGIFIPSKRTVLLKTDIDQWSYNTAKNSANTASDIDVTFISIHKFMYGIENSQIDMLELLFAMMSEKVIYKSDEVVDYIKSNYTKLILRVPNKMMEYHLKNFMSEDKRKIRQTELNLFIDIINSIDAKDDEKLNDSGIFDYLIKMIDKFKTIYYDGKFINIHGCKYDNRIKFGYLKTHVKNNIKSKLSKRANVKKNNKQLSHIARIVSFINELSNTNRVEFPMKNRKFLKSIKLGEVDREDVIEFINNQINQINQNYQTQFDKVAQNNMILNLLEYTGV